MTSLSPALLSELPEKRARYADDSYFLDGFEDVTEVCGDALGRFCDDHALLLVKPDAVVSRRLSPILTWLTGNGFSVVGAMPLTLSRHAVRALWQYGLNAASRDRRDAADLYMTAGPCVLLMLARPGGTEPATTVLSRAKGPAEPDRCRPGQLRHAAGSFNYQLNLVHTADEPADLVRELAVLCEHETRVSLLRRALGGASDDAYAVARRTEAATPEEDLDLHRTLARIAAVAGRAPELHRLVDRIGAGESRDWRRLLRLARERGVPVTTWQHIVVATYLLDPYLPGAAGLLPDASAC
jgi:nucleoside diphosphate kinase